MKKIGLLGIACAFVFTVNAQTAPVNNTVKFSNLDASPVDLLYYPLRAPNVKTEDQSVPIIKVIYSRPQKKGREIFGNLEKYGVVWRLGANESTEIRFSKPVQIGGKSVQPGTYSLFAIPNKDEWTIILNKKVDRWGAFSYEESKDVLRVKVPVKNLTDEIEVFSMTFTDRADGANLVMGWDKTMLELPIIFAKDVK